MTTDALLITPVVPNPSGIGIQRRAYQNWAALRLRHRVKTVVALESTVLPEPAYDMITETIVARLGLSRTVLGLGGARPPGTALIRDLFTYDPLERQPIPHNAQAALRSLDVGKPETAFVFRLRSWWILDELVRLGRITGRPVRVLDLDDLESSYCASMRERGSGVTGREAALVYRWRERKCIQSETLASRNFDLIMVNSREDKDALRARNPNANVAIAPNGYHFGSRPTTHPRTKELRIVFVGALNYGPNIEGVRFFAVQVLPLLLERISQPIFFDIVGANPSDRVLDLSTHQNVSVFPNVESVSPYYERATIAVLPIFFGAGTRIKALEAIAHGLAIVGTEAAMRGLQLQAEKHYRRAEATGEFIATCAELLTHPEHRMNLVEEAWSHAKSLYDSSTIQEHINKSIIKTSGVQ